MANGTLPSPIIVGTSRTLHPGQRATTYCSWWYARVPAVCASTGYHERYSEREGHTLVRGARRVPVSSCIFCRPCCSFLSGARRLQVPTHEQLARLFHVLCDCRCDGVGLWLTVPSLCGILAGSPSLPIRKPCIPCNGPWTHLSFRPLHQLRGLFRHKR